MGTDYSSKSRWIEALRFGNGPAILAFAYFAAAVVGLQLRSPGALASPIWPASGIGLAACLLYGIRLWPGIAIASFLSYFFVLPFNAAGVVSSFALAASNTLELIVAVLLTQRLTGTTGPFYRSKQVFGFVLSSTISCALASVIGVTAVWASGTVSSEVFRTVLASRWMGHLAGMLVLGPALYCWLREPQWRDKRVRQMEFVVVILISAAIAELRFGGWIETELGSFLPYAVVPGLLWSAFRLGVRETSTVSLLTSSIAITHTWRNMVLTQSGRLETIYAPFVSRSLTANQSLMMLQIFVCVVSVTAMALAAAISERTHAEERLRSAHAKLQQLSREMIRVRDSERRHLARELHDEIGQNLAALRINMELLRPPDDSCDDNLRVEDSIAIIDRVLEEVRDLSLSLRPPLLNETGLAAALDSYLKEQSARSGLPIDFASTIDDLSVRPDISIALFRISQEALTNALRYAQADRVTVSLNRVGDDIVLKIQDDGVGIPPQSREEKDLRPKLGLLGMEERTAQLGGKFSLRSVSGSGTVLSVQVPLRST